MNPVNMGKHVGEMRRTARLLTYNDITDIPASVLTVPLLFLENMPAEMRGSRLPWENIRPRPDGNPERGLTTTNKERSHG